MSETVKSSFAYAPSELVHTVSLLTSASGTKMSEQSGTESSVYEVNEIKTTAFNESFLELMSEHFVSATLKVYSALSSGITASDCAM